MHPALPQTMTPENLAQWIAYNRADTIVAKGTTAITKDERAEYEHISSDCSQKIDELDEKKKEFMEYINNGTYNPEIEEEKGNHVTIPATVGIKKLTEERKRVDKLLRDGFTTEKTTLYIIPWREEKKMVAFDSEGQEWEEYTRDMRDDEINQYRTLFESAAVGEDTVDAQEVADPLMEVSQGGAVEEVPAEEIIPEEIIAPVEPRRRRRGAQQSEEPII